MGSDDLFKKRRNARKQRGYEYKKPKANSFLIVTEGERTEPLYFKGIQKLIKEKIGGMVEVVEVPIIDICGGGCSTGKLIEVTERTVKMRNSSDRSAHLLRGPCENDSRVQKSHRRRRF